MTLTVEFKWPLNVGYEVIVEAEGTYYAEDNDVWPVTLSFVTPFQPEGNAHTILVGLAMEIDQIREHAKLCLVEKGHEEMKECAS